MRFAANPLVFTARTEGYAHQHIHSNRETYRCEMSDSETERETVREETKTEDTIEEEDSPQWLVANNSILYEVDTKEYEFMDDEFEPLVVESGKVMGELKVASSSKPWLANGLEEKHIVKLRSRTNDVKRQGLYVCLTNGEDGFNDYHTFVNITGKASVLLRDHYKARIDKLPEAEKEAAKKRYAPILSYEKPDTAPQPNCSVGWKRSTKFIANKTWFTALEVHKPKPRQKKEDKDDDIKGVLRTVKPQNAENSGAGASEAAPPKEKKEKKEKKRIEEESSDEEFDIDACKAGIRKRRRMNVDDYEGKLVTVPAWLFDEAMTTWMKKKDAEMKAAARA